MKKTKDNNRRSLQRMVRRQVLDAAKKMDWVQVVLNGGPPCFHLDTDGSFCGRAERWQGHDEMHGFVSLEDLLRVMPPNDPSSATRPTKRHE